MRLALAFIALMASALIVVGFYSVRPGLGMAAAGALLLLEAVSEKRKLP